MLAGSVANPFAAGRFAVGEARSSRRGTREVRWRIRPTGDWDHRARVRVRVMAKNIYVGNLPYETTSDDLVQLFQPYGSVISAQVVIDRFSNRSRGFGFVEMA